MRGGEIACVVGLGRSRVWRRRSVGVSEGSPWASSTRILTRFRADGDVAAPRSRRSAVDAEHRGSRRTRSNVSASMEGPSGSASARGARFERGLNAKFYSSRRPRRHWRGGSGDEEVSGTHPATLPATLGADQDRQRRLLVRFRIPSTRGVESTARVSILCPARRPRIRGNSSARRVK